MAGITGTAGGISLNRPVDGFHGWFRGPLIRIAAEVLRDQRWFIALVLIYLLAAVVIGPLYGQTVTLTLYNDVLLILYTLFAAGWFFGRTAWRLLKHHPAGPLRFIWADLRRHFFNPRRLLSALPAFVLLPLVLSTVTSLKLMIPLIEPFGWDPALAEFDRILHGGYHPWELLQPIFGNPTATALISNAYSFPWLIAVFFMQFWQTFTLDPRRMRFLITIVLCWILLGNGLAIALSSAGPVYYGYFVDGPNPFAPLMAYLNGVAEELYVPSVSVQAYLLENYEAGTFGLGTGISAMPSLHIALGLVLVLTTWHLHWSLRIVTGTYLVVLLIGSVHLGWHYAIDGYAAILATWLIWWAVGRALAWREQRTPRALPAPTA